MTEYNNTIAASLSEQSLLDLLRNLKTEANPFNRPRQMVISAEALNDAHWLASKDPEFARCLRDEFPSVADYLIGKE